MRHVNYTLRPKEIDAAKAAAKPYTLTDGGGLHIEVMPGGAKVWRFKYHLNDRREKVTLGHYPLLGIREARDEHERMRAMVARGESPARAKRQAPPVAAPVLTFRSYATRWLSETTAHLSPKYVAQTTRLLNDHVYPAIGERPFLEVEAAEVLSILDTLRHIPATAERVRTIVQQVYNHAIRNLVAKFNPATPLRGAIVVPPKEHHRHLVAAELGEFWLVLQDQGAHAVTVYAAQLLLLTMSRKMELLAARRKEFDLDAAIWDVPAVRMKMKRPHRVYLPRQAVTLLRVLFRMTATAGPEGHVFPSAYERRQSTHLGEATLNHLFRRMDFGVPEFSPHGTRGTAATLLLEHGVRRDVVELLLAHAEKDQTSAAYHHHELAAERREALQLLADLTDQLCVEARRKRKTPRVQASATA